MYNQKKIILLQPPNISKTFTRSGSIYPPLGLLQIAAMDNKNIIEVVDAEGLGLSEKETKNLLILKKPKILGLTITSFTIDIVEKWAKFGKEIEATVVVGGAHASLAPEDTFRQCKNVDIVVRGEAEEITNKLFSLILKNKDVSNIPGVCIRENDKILISNTILRVNNFNEIPFPKIENLPINNYWCPDMKHKPMITMNTIRGCPYACKFCSSSILMGRKMRGWSIDKIIKQLKYLHFEIGIKEISFIDDEFIINKKRTKQLCREIIDNNIDISWFCNARADTIDIEVATIMKQAGCHQVYLGFESGSQKILDLVDKKTNIEKMIKGADVLKKVGIDRSVGFIIGLPGETEETVNKSIELAKIIQPERLQFTRFTPLIGTALYDNRELNGFHNIENDIIGKWITKAYYEFKNVSWAKKSI